MKTSLTIEFTVPETTDLCWTKDGVQCFYDAVLKQAHTRILESMRRLAADAPDEVRQHYQRHLDVVRSVTVNGDRLLPDTEAQSNAG